MQVWLRVLKEFPLHVLLSHVAFSSVRVEPTWIVLGQSAGIAAAVAAEGGVAVQDVNYDQLAERLKKRGQILAPQ